MSSQENVRMAAKSRRGTGKPKQGTKTDCASCAHETVSSHPDHSDELNRLRRVQGQIKGIESMILARRYCPEILIQFRAAVSALRAAENAVFERHLRGCVKGAMDSKSATEIDRKVEELLELLVNRS